MDVTIKWLHLTDLHLGLDGQEWLWPRVKHLFLEDLRRLQDEMGEPWDLVFFTGDLTQAGTAEQFDRLEEELQEMWSGFRTSGAVPQLCVVPGNHDLSRLPKNSPVELALRSLWQQDVELRKLFWRDRGCEYREAVRQSFAAYTAWRSRSALPIIGTESQWIPGDFSGTFQKGNVSLGIVGLNSATLQLSKGDYERKLEVHVSQLAEVTGGEPIKWMRRHSSCVLLSHHPPHWLSPESLEHFRQEVYGPGEFMAHFCGHQHEPYTADVGEGGAAPRRLRQAASLFGLESWDSQQGEQRRIHGYTAGQYVFRSDDTIETYFPRRADKGRHGGLTLGADSTFNLTPKGCVVGVLERPRTVSVSGPRTAIEHEEARLDDVLGAVLDRDAARAALRGCPRFPLTATAPHRAIRSEQRTELVGTLKLRRQVWLAADWGMAAREFLASALDPVADSGTELEAFLLSCDDLLRIEDFEPAFHRQLGIALQSFCAAVGSLDQSVLVLENVHPELCIERNLAQLLRIVGALVDYAGTLNVILVGRLRPENMAIPLVQLVALDVPEVRAYVAAHPDASTELLEADALEKLHARTDGLPMYLDQALRALKVSSLSSVLAMSASVLGPEFAGATEPTTRALAHAVQSLVTSEDRQARRSLRLLKVLTILPQGETLEALKHYLPTEPFFDGNAIHLYERALLEVHVQHAVPDGLPGRSLPGAAPKILRVPRQVRDYVQSVLGDSERSELVSAGLDRFFGNEWREGKVRLRQTRPETRDLMGDGLGNEFALVQYICANGLLSGDELLAGKYCQLALQYCRGVCNHDRYRDLATASVALLSHIDRQRRPDVWADLAVLAGKGLRMTGHCDEALTYLRDALEYEALSKENKASVWLNIALAEANRSNQQEAADAARHVEALVPKHSSDWYQAESILVDVLHSGRERAKRLVRLEKDARNKGYRTVADNIALNLARDASDPKARWRYHDRVLNAPEFGYNQVRAAVAKARSVQRAGRAGQMGRADLVILARAYSYLHAQRLNFLFENCHEALWIELEARDETQQLLRLFRHTSFLWRIRGNDTKELEYLSRLQERPVEQVKAPAGRLLDELQYFWSRVRVILGIGGPGA